MEIYFVEMSKFIKSKKEKTKRMEDIEISPQEIVIIGIEQNNIDLL